MEAEVSCNICEIGMRPIFTPLGEKYYVCDSCGAEVTVNLKQETEG